VSAVTLSPRARIAHVAWKAACEDARARASRVPAFGMDPDRARYFAELDRLRQEGYEADRVRAAAFKNMAEALPEAEKITFISPREWLAKGEVWRTEYAPVKVWNPSYRGWYPCIGHYEIDTSTGERFLRAAHMFDDCVDEAERRNDGLALYAEAKRTGDYSAYYAKYPPRAA
jgi:hypothetical protein